MIEPAPANDRFAQARERRRRWCADARILGGIAFEADCSRAPLVAPGSVRAGSLLAAAWERRAGLSGISPVDAGPLPDWAKADKARRRELAVLTGAILRARSLRESIDGVLLKTVAAAIGEERLDLITRFFARRESPVSLAWAPDPIAQLHALGGEVLLRAGDFAPALHARLSMLFPVSVELTRAEPATLRRIADDARMLWGADAPQAMETSA
jgi:hypothetical protein